MDIIQPKVMQSPISGEPMRPTIRTYINGNQEITEAIYTDPASGIFVHKGVISVKDISKSSKA
jgi:hypothetical protein